MSMAQINNKSAESNGFGGATKSTAARGCFIYEGDRAVNEYLQFHYGRPEEVLPYKCGPTEALGFTKRGAELCIKAMGSSKASTEGFRTESSNGGISNGGSHITAGTTPRKKHLRAMDVGCSVGGVTFELTKGFDEVVGVDYSARFVETAESMRVEGRQPYQCLEQGSVALRREAVLPEGVVPSRARFVKGDACALDIEALGSFDAVIASNLLCRLQKPRKLLTDLHTLVKPGGVAVIISPYSWQAEYTDPSEWLGGCREGGNGNGHGKGAFIDSFDAICAIREADGRFKLEERMPMPFLIREHAREFQYGCSDGLVWRRLSSSS